ncbi:phosphatase PAP2 family protein [Magnetovibrio blakemorei]|uniref:Inositolphosphotransferase Aur1/Ipt1 domain-containing protein n=1 Tax=Magnetovibrio blakemorei TaxID=28181 RepID=A0A1E5Q362_9PROT|nr:phosphatase PAP2 family protein [Magnetovibrio blakemorei]OEJ64042.1 hypothetical protein BEN30_01145 [Magnetovibrio blakemorei]
MQERIEGRSVGLNYLLRAARPIVDAVKEFKLLIPLIVAYVLAVEVIMMVLTNRTSGLLSGYGNIANIWHGHLLPYLIHRVGPFVIVSAMVGAVWILFSHFYRPLPRVSLSHRIIKTLKFATAPERLVRLCIFIMIFMPFMTSFSSFKAAIPDLAVREWDFTFAEIDRTLHGQTDPWHVTWALFGSPSGTVFLDQVYSSWFLVVFTAPFACLYFDNNASRRVRFITAHALLWMVLGSAMAWAFFSVGPCYLEPIYGVDAGFAPLMDKLYAINETSPLTAIVLQETLLDAYQGGVGKYEGLSAMPSLHVAQAVLVACLAQSYGRIAGALAWGYATLILIGSIHLGWHYAIDGYVSVVMTMAIWWMLGGWQRQVQVPNAA